MNIDNELRKKYIAFHRQSGKTLTCLAIQLQEAGMSPEDIKIIIEMIIRGPNYDPKPKNKPNTN